MVYSAKSDDIGTISQFTRLKYIYVTTNGSSTPANYQVKLTIAYEPEMQADFRDIRFNTLGNVYIDYWIESKTDSVSAIVWVKLPNAITDPGSDTIWMYYGNAGLSDGGDGDDTFEFFEDFEDLNIGNLNGQNGWTTSGSINVTNSVSYEGNQSALTTLSTVSAYGSKDITPLLSGRITYYFRGTGTERSMSQINAVTDGKTALMLNDHDYGRNGIIYAFEGAWDNVVRMVTADSTWYKGEMIWTPTTWKLYVDDSLIISKSWSTQLSTGIEKITLGHRVSQTNGQDAFDLIYIQKYITNEPTPTYGTAQHQRRVPQFI